MEKKELKNDIIKDAYYLINLYHKNGKKITQLHIQKLMFLFEAYYMNKYDVDKLYDCNYQAWDFGPVVIHLHKKFKKYGREDVKLTDEEIEIGNSIAPDKKETMEEIYSLFGKFTAIQLVNFTHAKGSPWYVVWNNIGHYSDIPKLQIKKWFEKYIVNE